MNRLVEELIADRKDALIREGLLLGIHRGRTEGPAEGGNSNLNVAQAFQPASFLSPISAGWVPHKSEWLP
ncbi:MAG: hypothetical protein V2B18_02400 [Pseudomonadota bacterium]